MKPVLTANQMRTADSRTISDFGIPGFALMEVAGREAADRIVEHFGVGDGTRICCLCGKGNNGGDALVVARCLYGRGADITVRLPLGAENLSRDAAANLAIAERLASSDPGRFDIAYGPEADFRHCDVIVDGILGTGLTKPLREPLLGVVESLNAAGKTVVALDVPTGIHTDTGAIMGAAVRARLTVTMAAMKAGLLLGDGPAHAGLVHIADIGIPDFILSEAADSPPGPISCPEVNDIVSMLPSRDRRAHKYSAGLALIVAGSHGLSGAPVMASTSAARVGAGAVVCAAPESLQTSLESRLTEVMTLALPSGQDGVSASAAIAAVTSRLEQARALLVGPGIGRQPSTGEFVDMLLSSSELPTVVDADGLFHLARDVSNIAPRSRGRWVLTPHMGELRRLAGSNVETDNRVETVRSLAGEWDSVVVFKGAPTVVGTPDRTVYIAPRGNQALATAGSGDVLSGMITGFMAQGLAPVEAALCALYVGGLAVERLAARVNRDSVMAMDIVAELPSVLKSVRD